MAQKNGNDDWSEELPDSVVLFTASAAGDVTAVQAWIRKAISIWNNGQRRRGHTHTAGPVLLELPDVIKRLLTKGLCKACSYGHEETVKVFLNGGADPTANGCYGYHDTRTFERYHSPLEAAAATDNVGILKLLIDHLSKTDLDSQHYDRALHVAVQKTGRSHIAKLLIEHGANVNAMHGREDVLASAIHSGNEETVKVLIHHGATLRLQISRNNVFCEWEKKIHALDKAAEYGLEEMVRLLISANGDAQTRQVVYSVALYQAAREGHITIAKMLIQSAADLNLSINFPVMGNGKKGTLSCLTQASRSGHQEMVKLLLENGADPNHADYEGETALCAAVIRNYVAIVRLLVKNGARVHEHRMTENTDALHDLLYVNEFGILVSKLVYPASGNELHVAASKGYAEMVKILIQYGANVNAQEKNQEQPLHVGVKHGHVDVIKVLLANSADIDAVAGSQGTAFDIAVKYCFQDAFETLVEHKLTVHDCKNDVLANMMYMAIEIGHEKVVKALIRCGTDLDTRGGWYGTPLENACVLGYKNIVEVLLENGASPNVSGGYYGSALQAAAAHSHENIVSILLRNGAAINATGGHFGTALRAAVEVGSEEVVTILAAEGADINYFQSASNSVLLVASMRGFQNIVAILLEHGADVNARGGWYGNALEAALACGHERTVDVLLENGGELINC